MRIQDSLFFILLVLTACQSQIPPDARKALQDRVDRGIVPGAAVVLVDAKGEHFESFGSIRLDRKVRPTQDSLFEIASLSKLFTGLVLADMVEKGELSLDDPAEKWLKPAMRTPRFKGQTYSLWHLVTHRSGLPRDLGLYDSVDENQLNALIPNTSLVTAPGPTVAYSNYGIAVLAKALADRSERSFEALLQERINGPLGLQDTAFKLDDNQARRLAQGSHDGAPVAPLQLKAFGPAWGLKSSARDLTRFLKAQLGAAPALADAIELSHKQVSIGDAPMALGWIIAKSPGGPVLFHTGVSPGFRSFIALRLSDRRGVVLLSNSDKSCEDIAWHLLDPSFALQDWRSRVALSDDALALLCGRYQTEKWGVLEVVRSGDGLLAQVVGWSPVQLEAQSPKEFVNAGDQIRVHFELDEMGKALSLTWMGQKATKLQE